MDEAIAVAGVARRLAVVVKLADLQLVGWVRFSSQMQVMASWRGYYICVLMLLYMCVLMQAMLVDFHLDSAFNVTNTKNKFSRSIISFGGPIGNSMRTPVC